METYRLKHLIMATIGFGGILTPDHILAASVSLIPTDSFRFGTIVGHDPGFVCVYNNPTDGNIQRSILRFDFSLVPTGATINSATLTLTCYPFNLYTQPPGTHSDVFAVAVPWDNTANWMNASSGVPWTTPGGDVTGPAYATNSQSSISDTNRDPVSWDVTSLVSEWHNGTLPNLGMLLTGTAGNQLTFYSTSAPLPYDTAEVDPAYYPKLSVTYSIPEPSTSVFSGLAIVGLLCVRRRSNATE